MQLQILFYIRCDIVRSIRFLFQDLNIRWHFLQSKFAKYWYHNNYQTIALNALQRY